MNREQMIAWLTIEGWDSVQCADGARYARHQATHKFMYIGSYVQARYGYADKSQIGNAEPTDWADWSVSSLLRVIRAVEH